MAARGVISAWWAGWCLLWGNKRMWLWVWIAHVATAALLAAIFSSIWSELLGSTLAAAQFGGPGTANILVDLFAHHSDTLRGLFPGAFLFGNPLAFLVLLYAWIGVILAAGILAGLSRSVPLTQDAEKDPGEADDDEMPGTGRARLAERSADLGLPFLGKFLRDCGSYAGRFTRLMIVHIIAMGVILFALASVLGRVADAISGPYPDPATGTWVRLVEVGILALAYLVLTVVGDYAKVRLVREERRSAFFAWWAGLIWAFRRLPRTLGLHLVFVLLAVAGSALYWYSASMGSLGETVIAIALVQQAYLIFRAGLRVHWYAAELSLFDGLQS
jgi:hypothetical protein